MATVPAAAMAAMPGKAEDLNPKRAVYLLPAATQFETSGSCTASNRSIQWREKVIDPLWESRSDHMIMYELADKLGFGKELVKNYKMQKVKGRDEPLPEDILREIKTRGREPAIWVAPFVASPDSKILREHPEWFVKGDDGKVAPFEVKVGDRVLISKYGGTEVKLDDKKYTLVREDDILGVIG